MSRKRRRERSAGFMLVEVLVALAVLSAIFAAIGGVLAITSRTARGIEQRLAMSAVAETLLTDLDRAALSIGRSAGERAGQRWRREVTPLPPEATGTVRHPNWQPVAVTLTVEAPSGQALQVATVRLLRQPDR